MLDNILIMTIHYHGTPITPIKSLMELKGRHFCVSHARPEDVGRCHEIGQSVMLDNGAFSKWKLNKNTNWNKYYAWTEKWCEYPTTWAIPPDVIDGLEEMQDELLFLWPHGKKQAAPVWHMNEDISRLLRLIDENWNRVCIGSSGEYASVMSDKWRRRMDYVWDEIVTVFSITPPMHMLRGMQCCKKEWPFMSVDSTVVARNHKNKGQTKSIIDLVDAWDGLQCPPKWVHTSKREV